MYFSEVQIVQWLSKGKVLKRFFYLREEIKLCIHEQKVELPTRSTNIRIFVKIYIFGKCNSHVA